MDSIENKIITQTMQWIKSVVIDCNFCPFAAKVYFNKSIHYTIILENDDRNINTILYTELERLKKNESIETSFVIFEKKYSTFKEYLKMLKKAEKYISSSGNDGIYQIASFHPDYCFANSEENDPANYTNRSLYPMLHILREESVTQALKLFKDPEKIPERNIDFSHKKGLKYMQVLRASCF
jgi:hypothetical protein